ncbi:hypothetical protein COO60DRAFT_1678673 [Scenedesmus sp. NREL 46B-D3]|nr:hypothetical protein COO60DRAFT_1678673 [Scenedesmus sp. NREL 46B-D3]
MYPFDFAPQCEVLLLLASAPKHALHHNDLGCSGKLQFRVHARELGKEQVQLLETDLSVFVGHKAKAAGPLSNGHQTMVVAGVYTNPQGWTLSFDCSTFPEDSWGLLLPQLRSLLQRWPTLSAADNARKLPRRQTVMCSRKGEDHALPALAARLWPQVPAPDVGTSAGDAGSSSTYLQDEKTAEAAGAQEQLRGSLDGSLADVADAPAAAAAAAAAGIDRLVLELGWEVFTPKAGVDDEDEEEEPPTVDFSLTLYNLQGEELATITPDNTEADGATLGDEEPEEPDEPEPEPAEAAAAAADQPAVAGQAAAAGEGSASQLDENAGGDTGGAGSAEGEDGEGGAEQREPPEEDEEVKARRAAAEAEAAAAAAQKAAANQRPLAERFPLRRKVHLSLPELPPGARAMLLSMSNFGGGGFKNVKSLQARLVLAEPEQQHMGGEGQEAAADEATDEEAPKPKKKGPKQQPKVLLHYRFDSVQGADGHLSQLLLLKLYKEYPDSAFAVWEQQQVPGIAALLGGSAAAAAGGAGGAAPERAKEVLQQVLATRKKLEAELAELAAKAEEEGLDEEEEQQDLRLVRGRAVALSGGASVATAGCQPTMLARPFMCLLCRAHYDRYIRVRKLIRPFMQHVVLTLHLLLVVVERGVWRARVLGAAAGGSGPEDLTDTVNNMLAYDGELDAAGLRSSGAAKVSFPNRDTYYGGYAADAKAGLGLYVFANGGAYVGQYEAGKRQGQGLMIMPDGGLYRGGFVADKFEGQGTYLYPDSSCYTGSWRAGRKHGSGTYWDTAAGCLRGEWAGGALRGRGQYDQPNHHFEGTFAQGVPAGARLLLLRGGGGGGCGWGWG